ncbi:hypothetical protein SAMN06295879_2779 [Agreia bicolorata]|uniref:Uncharacterized protein n=1 Tax=Agreia bicolorata TaxID=110935 RepID=A0A1T4YC53_9MICO|nr:hypothetical protein [Agreia bicolorata]SKA99364.1 hypothetical protein SAMN06295879_2779 [Agreia bicolorata]
MIEQANQPHRETSSEPLSSRVVSWVVGLGLGALFGVMGTAVSQSTWMIASGFSLPIGLIVALLAVTLLLVGLRLVLRTRTTAILAAFGIVVTIFLLSQPSAGGSILVPGNALGVTWTFAPTIIALLVLAWPRLMKN